jgi:hypothetical protein
MGGVKSEGSAEVLWTMQAMSIVQHGAGLPVRAF